MDCQQVVVVVLQDAGVEGGQVGLPAHVLGVNLGGGKVAAEDEVGLVDFGAAVAAGQDAAVAHHGAHAVVLVAHGGALWQQRLEVVTDGEDVLVAGVVEVHQLADPHAVLGEGEVVGKVDVVVDVFPGNDDCRFLPLFFSFFDPKTAQIFIMWPQEMHIT